MDTIIQILNWLGTSMPILLAVGAGWKFLPIARKYTNEVIPLLNAVVAFLIAFGGGAQPAQAGFLGDLGRGLVVPGQIAGAVLLSWFTSWVHDKFLKGITPPSPYRELTAQK